MADRSKKPKIKLSGVQLDLPMSSSRLLDRLMVVLILYVLMHYVIKPFLKANEFLLVFTTN